MHNNNVTVLLEKMIASGKTPGVQYAFFDKDTVLVSATKGTADLKRRIPMHTATTFNGFSLTKTFTAAAILKLAENGKLDLDEPVSKYVPDLSRPKSPTIRQTLQHTGGFSNPIPIGWAHLATEHDTFDEGAFIRRMLAKHGHRLKSAPGERFAYSNIGYLVLGEVIRKASGGASYTSYVQREIIAPLGLASDEVLRFSIADAPPEQHARGHVRVISALNAALCLFIDRKKLMTDNSIDGWAQFRDLQVDGSAYGGIIGNVAGFTRYLQAILRMTQPFSPRTCDLLFTQGKKTTSGEQLPIGLSWLSGTLHREPYFAHAGAGGGHYCEIRVYPRIGRASVILFNRAAMSDERVLDRIDPL